MLKKTVIAFDFDGTLTSKDTFIEFIKYTKGKFIFFIVIMIFFPKILLFKLKLYPNWKLKEQMFSFLFKGTSQKEFNKICENFCRENYDTIIRSSSIEYINKCKKNKYEMIIISASIVNWVKPFANRLGIKLVEGTELEITNDGLISGLFLSKNCYGQEKVNRLLKHFPCRNDYILNAFGDSKGDEALLKYADNSFFRKFI